MVHRQAVVIEDLFQYPLKALGRSADIADERRDLVYLCAVDGDQLFDVRSRLVVRGDEYLCLQPLQHFERREELCHVVDEYDVVLCNDIGAENRVGEEAGSVVCHDPDHV